MSQATTIITMYRGHDGEMFVQAVEGELTDEQKDTWRKAHSCDDHYVGHEDHVNNMFFRVLEVRPNKGTSDLFNVDPPGAD